MLRHPIILWNERGERGRERGREIGRKGVSVGWDGRGKGESGR